jgi:glycosyltransferase involved in cell wall biosynthesis
MNICIITDSFPPAIGGISLFYKHLAALMVAYNHKVFVLTVNASSDQDDEVTQTEAVTIIRLRKPYKSFYNQFKPYFRPGGHDAPHWLAMGFAFREWLLSHHKNYEIDLIEVMDYGGLGAFILHETLPPFVITAHSALTQLQGLSNQADNDHINVLKQLEQIAFTNADGVIAHSLLNQESVSKVFKRSCRFARAPWQGVQAELLHNSDETPLIIGGLQNVKGSIFLAEALSHCKRMGKPVEVRWIGYDTHTAPSGRLMSGNIARQFRDVWQKEFRWLGQKNYSEAMKTLEQASFLIIPSLWETFNYTALEAAMFGKAIIITKTTGASYLFTHMHDAVLIEAGDAEQLANAIVLLDTDKALRSRLGENARQTISSYFDRHKIYEERIAIYREVLNAPKKRPSFEPEMAILQRYTTPSRKYYYSLRAFLKKILKPTKKD